MRRLSAELPAQTAVLPTHGFGSFCSATPTSGDASTVGEQARVNPALTLNEQDYVDTLLAGLDAYPACYARMGPINRRGPAPVDLLAPEPVEPAELRRRIQAGEWVVDLRERRPPGCVDQRRLRQRRLRRPAGRAPHPRRRRGRARRGRHSLTGHHRRHDTLEGDP